MATQTKRIAGLAEIRLVGAAVGGMATDTGKPVTTDGVEAVRQIIVAGFAKGVGAVDQQVIETAAVGLVAGLTLVG